MNDPMILEFTRADARRWVREPGPSDDKYTRGVLGVVTGSHDYPGAAVLGVEAAIRTGVGMLRYTGPGRVCDLVLHRRPEVVTVAGRVQAWLLGSGMDARTRTAQQRETLVAAAYSGVPCVLDAGALDLTGETSGPAVITPHARELARLLSSRGVPVTEEEISADPCSWAARAARELQSTVLLKGHQTVVSDAEGQLRVLPRATGWLATAGTGDVLAGILGALCATNAEVIVGDPRTLASVAATSVVIHSRAAELASAGGPIAALDIAGMIGRAVAELAAD
ncbi:hypothetical protein GCM10022198_11880 [Klugiella xanthotipulae]|uniref:ADP-dependent (S)-NAD(P)H-hydrate dehydratase n=1 Tax=Klugiella xanthotipulae TaxID=244735 RepID=A0A543I4U1_9MICO|nr:ADP/ATP-dependent (S)-NAD(P)H-hydrate dehydratase [Klugiella xanthotipulae]TQM65571.1 hydroxyethylthiazole kinase-like uncharacterized protein yjeF [Klugiella xanthotipulae]